MALKLLAYVSSRNVNSSTNRIVNEIIERVTMEHGEIIVKKITPLEYNLFPATGCRSCFLLGDCPSNKLEGDKALEFKKEILESNIIIMASPVFSHNVSGDMKNVIDRLSYWTHIFRLATKKMYLIATADSNGADYVNNYMNKVFTSMGVTVVRSDSFLKTNKLQENYQIKSIVNSLSKEIKSKKEILPSQGQEKLFQFYKSVIKTYSQDNFEFIYYKRSGLLASDTLEQFYKTLKGGEVYEQRRD